MGRRLLLVNILILVLIVVLARYLTTAWHDFDETQNVASVLGDGKTPPPAPVSVEIPPPPEAPQPYPDFTIIAEKDLFMPERRPAPLQEEAVKVVAPKLAKNPALNGVLNNAGSKQALITIYEGNNPKGTPRTVSVGDDVQGYTVTEIADTTMKMRFQETDEILIDMFDVSPQQQAAVPSKGTSAAPTIVTIGSAAAPVETTTSAENAPDEGRGGLEVGVAGGQGVAGQRGQGQAMRPGNVNRGSMGADTMRGGMGGPGVTGAGTVSGGNSVPFSSGNRRRNIR
jgi:hypothetical protein